MPAFPSRPLNVSPLNRTFRKYPLLFGIPFILIVAGASYGLIPFAQTRYELQDRKVSQVSKEQELGLDKHGKPFDIREEYFKLSAKADENWEPKRIERPKGLPEWGVPPTNRTEPEPKPKPS